MPVKGMGVQVPPRTRSYVHGIQWPGPDYYCIFSWLVHDSYQQLGVSSARPAVPTLGEYVPVAEAVTAGTRRAYGSYWNRVVEHWGDRRLDEPTPSEIRQLMAHARTHVADLGRAQLRLRHRPRLRWPHQWGQRSWGHLTYVHIRPGQPA